MSEPEIVDATIVQLCQSSVPLRCKGHAVVCLALVEVRYADDRVVREIRPVTGPYLGRHLYDSDAGPDLISLRAEDDIYYGATAGDDLGGPVVGLLDVQARLEVDS